MKQTQKLVSHKQEKVKLGGYSGISSIPDKMRINGVVHEEYQLFYNRADAAIFIKEQPKIMEKYFKFHVELEIQQFVQSPNVFYVVYGDRWNVIKDGVSIEDDSNWYITAINDGTWSKYQAELKAKFGRDV